MCDAEVRLVVLRSKVSKPYRYFCVFTTDLTLEYLNSSHTIVRGGK